ncbi:hypothetical protein E4U17_006802 [Claviceps sp. LM77 group G4]|nr:hypothetical protein E4U17_006802 [Claviceps sp. LM77 group G4]KAG6067327.1 hypothetical protein E4U16_008211 [Claviceps sp. LM84 group G4]KAG6070502.1 hypothetical protein E4U33_004152 [Claviceps sp. LM78 group G4]
MLLATLFIMAMQASAALAAPLHFTAGILENLVTFGDSYTDEGRFSYFQQNHRAPPTGVMLPPSNATSSGGASWARFVANSTGAQLYNYAVSGGMCSNNIDSRDLEAIHAPFPSVLEYQVPVFEQDILSRELYPRRRADNTVYALWIGTNDVGVYGFLGDKNKENTTLTSYLDCNWQVFDHVYHAGGRHFVVLNIAPLRHAPMYASPGEYGPRNSVYAHDPAAYVVPEVSHKLHEYVTSINTMFEYGAAFNLAVKRRWPGATLSVFDVHTLMMDVLVEPARYLDEPVNVKAPYRVCKDGCVDSKDPKTSFMWYDELHPSERMHTIFAKHFMEVVQGRSRYGQYYA